MFRDICVYFSSVDILMQAEQSEIEEKLKYLEQEVEKVENLLFRLSIKFSISFSWAYPVFCSLFLSS